MSHRRAKRIRKIFKSMPGVTKPGLRNLLKLTKGAELPTLKEMHRADVHADIPDPKPTGIL